MIAGIARGQICGLGVDSYLLAASARCQRSKSGRASTHRTAPIFHLDPQVNGQSTIKAVVSRFGDLCAFAPLR